MIKDELPTEAALKQSADEADTTFTVTSASDFTPVNETMKKDGNAFKLMLLGIHSAPE
jgi:hypothetical protein